MNIIWKNSVVGAELVLENHENEEPERVLGAVEIAHGYAFGWAYNSLGNKIYLPSLFSETNPANRSAPTTRIARRA